MTFIPDTTDPDSRQTRPWRLLRRVLPVAMLIVLLLGLGGGVRMAFYVGQPFPGFALMWRKESKLLTVSWTTPSHWPAIATGQMRINDRILCIDGYHPSPDSPIYGLESLYAAIQCENGEQHYAAIFRERFASGDPTVEFLVDREGTLLRVPNVPLVRFTWSMLAETYLPVFFLGLGLLIVGAVVYRADPKAEANLTFCVFATLIAVLILQQTYVGRFSDRSAGIADTRAISLVMIAPWMPLLGVVTFHLISLLTDQSGFLQFAGRVLRSYYGVSLAFAALGLFVYAEPVESLTIIPNWVYTWFLSGSALFAWVWGTISLAWTARHTSSRRTRRQALLVLTGLVVMAVLLAPALITTFINVSIFRYVYSLPYFALAFVALLAYAILRYQLFSAKSSVLIALLVVIFCIVTANVVYLAIGQASGFLPILAATLITAASLTARRGPTTFFTRLLRRETLDYGVVARFGQQVGGLQHSTALIQATWDCLARDLEVEHLHIWLLDEELRRLEYFRDGQLADSIAIPMGLVEQLTKQWGPQRSGSPANAPYTRWLAANDVMLWVPLTDRGHAVGLMGLGPRWTGEIYDEPDVQLIGILSRRLALSILNTRQLERLQATSRLILQAEENERRKIAHELHDTVLQFLLVLTYGLDDLRERQAALAGEIEHWQDRISAEASQLRGLLSYLRAPELLVQQGLVHSLHAWLGQMRQETSLTIETDLDEEIEPLLTTEAKVAIYRVCREAVHNAVKHAQATRIMLHLGQDDQRVVLVVEDNGQGFDVTQALEPKAKGYSSLQDMSIYMKSIGGRLEVRSTPEMGTTIDAWTPIKIDDQGETVN